MIRIKGGASKKNTSSKKNVGNVSDIKNDEDKVYIKDSDVVEKYKDRKFVIDKTLMLSDENFYKTQLLFYYKKLVNDIDFKDDKNAYIDIYYDKLKDKLKDIVSDSNTINHFNRICFEFDVNHDMDIALKNLYERLQILKNGKNIIIKDARDLNDVENKTFKNITKSLITSEKELIECLKFSKKKNEVVKIFKKFVCGIYVKIKNNELQIFQPFFNKNYKNDWVNIWFELNDKSLTQDHNVYYSEKAKQYRKEHVLKNIKNWWNNGYIVDNEYYTSYENGKRTVKYWSEYGFNNLIFILKKLCINKNIKDCEFIINKRDYPITSESENIDIPVFSFYSSEKFKNKCIPTNEDIDIVFKNKIEPESEANVKWEDKKNIALFRGSATGTGINTDTNQRLKLAQLSLTIDNLDAKLTAINSRDRFIFKDRSNKSIYSDLKNESIKKIITHIRTSEFEHDLNASKSNFISMNDQVKYKYVIYCEGHSAANRYSKLMSIGSVILKVESTCDASDMWYFKHLKPYVHYVPVKADLSDLQDKINWCVENDNLCKIIVLNAEIFYKTYLSKEYILHYWSECLNSISSNSEMLEIKNDYKPKTEDIKDLILSTTDATSEEIERVKTKTLIPKMPAKINIISDNNNDIKSLLNKKDKIDEQVMPFVKQYEENIINAINKIYDSNI